MTPLFLPRFWETEVVDKKPFLLYIQVRDIVAFERSCMLNARYKDTKLEKIHGHCADVLIEDYGVPYEHRPLICEEIDKIYLQISLIHCLIIASVRGWRPVPATDDLKALLERVKGHKPKNHKWTLF